MYYLNFAAACILTTSDPMPEAEIEDKLSQLKEIAELTKTAFAKASGSEAAVKEAATAGAAAIAEAPAQSESGIPAPTSPNATDKERADVPLTAVPLRVSEKPITTKGGGRTWETTRGKKISD